MKTELEMRISELEEELGRIDPGSQEYECVAKDHSTLVKSYNDIRKTEAEIDVKYESLELEKSKAEDDRIDKEKRTEIERKSKSFWRRAGEICLGTLLPAGAYMVWEETGHIFKGQWQKWIQKPR